MSDDKPKTTHPAEVNEALGIAHSRCNRLIEDAERRGDQAGADAWLVARNVIEAAEKAMREAREKQTWRVVQGERVDAQRFPPMLFPPTLRVACPNCGAGMGERCVFTPQERALLGDAERVHRERANQIGMDFKPRARCGAWSYPGRQCALLAGHVGDHELMDCCDRPRTRRNTNGQMVCPVHCSKCGHDRKHEDYLDYCTKCRPGDPCSAASE